MIQRRNGLGLALEAFTELSSRDFDGNIALQTRIVGAIHFTHAARAEHPENFVWT